MKVKHCIGNQKGSVTVEFLGVLPLVFLVMLICWQFLMGAYAVITAQSAANEAAKVFAITGSSSQARSAARDIVNAAGGGISFHSAEISSGWDSYFTAKVGVNVDLVFLPDYIRKNMSPDTRVISFEREITSREIH